MEKKTNETKGETKKEVKVLSTSSLQMSQQNASHLVGSIVEKGVSDSPTPYPLPKPTLLPFPVARHRSHGPHWHPLSSKRDNVNDDEDDEDEEDKAFLDFGNVSAFANPVQRRKKKGLDFGKWKEITQDYSSPLGKKAEDDMPHFSQTASKNKNEKDRKSAPNKARPSVDSANDMELDLSDKVDLQEQDKFAINFDNMEENDFAAERDRICDDRMPDYNVGSLDALRQDENNVTTSMVSSSGSNNFRSERVSMSIESEIDAENEARIKQMSPEEIAEAQAEIMEKMSPALLKLLQRRGQEKLKKQNKVKFEAGSGSEPVNQHVQNTQDAKHLHTEDGNFNMVVEPQLDSKPGDEKNRENSLSLASNSSWNAWSNSVEAVRELRFSLDGEVIATDRVPVCDNLAERDYLRTEGDPGAAGYTVKEAVALTRSVVPGQRSLALHLLSSVLGKALHYICEDRAGHMSKSENKVDKSVDWKAVWAFALGPEPELVLSLRMCLDDNHNSVVLACAKVVQSVLSYDVNENFFDISGMATCDKDICTAPVFRSRPDIDLGFLHGGFWKYSAKPSNILPFSEGSMDDETEGKHTIQDDVVVAGQDFTAGLVRMGILPRLLYLLETDPSAALEECIISILIAIVRHSPSCANAVLKCERLIQTIVNRFTVGNLEIRSSMIKSVNLMKVLARLDRKICLEFTRNGYFQAMTWNLYQSPSSVDHWLKLGKEKCKLGSALIVEQLRFLRVCIQYGYCVSNFSDMFPALCFWLNPQSFGKLVEKNVLYESASISREAYLVLESLAGRLPDLFSQLSSNQSAGDTEVWSWSYVGPMVDSALSWIATRSDSEVSKLFEEQKEGRFVLASHELSATPLLWVYAAVTQMLFRILERMTLRDTTILQKTDEHVPWLPGFVPKIGLKLIKHWLSGFSEDGKSFMKELIYLREMGDVEMSLASTCCLNGIVNIITTIDKLIQSAKTGICNLPCQEQSLSKEGKVLEDGILSWSLVELRSVLNVFTRSVDSGWRCMQSIEIFGRGGPAPGVGIGWGASHGGFWSKTVLSAQIDARLLTCLLETFQNTSGHVAISEGTTFTIHKINSAFGLCLTAGPRDMVVVDKALELLLDISVLKFLDLCAQDFLNKSGKTCGWKHVEEDYKHFSRLLLSHFRSRWLSVKVKSKAVDGSSSSGSKTSLKDARLDTIFEDSDVSPSISPCYTSLTIEWARQKLPLPVHFYLSPISTISGSKRSGPQKVESVDIAQDPANLLEVAQSGLFFVLGVEAMSISQGTDIPSPIQHVPLTWKLHSLSVNFLVGMEILEQEQGREAFEALQDLYAELLDKERLKQSKKTVADDKNHIEFLKFQSEIHESYSIIIEDLVEQFSAISYGDLIFGRQVSLYLHRCVESSIRLAAWNTLSNARVLELLPPLEKCFSAAEGYLEPIEDNEGILEAYAKSWVSDALDRAAIRGSIAYTMVVHHLSSFIFNACLGDKLLLRNRLARSLLRDYAGKQQHEGMLLNLISHSKPLATRGTLEKSWLEWRLQVLVEACEGNSSLLKQVDKLKAVAEKCV